MMRRSKVSVKAVVLFICLFFSGFAMLEAEASPGTISGTVSEEETSLPLSGVTVKAFKAFGNWLVAAETTTAGDGTYLLSGPDLEPGKYYVLANFAGHGAVVASPVFVNSGQATAAPDLFMTNNPGSITGAVTDGGGGVAGLSVNCYLRTTDGIWAMLDKGDTTDAAGSFMLNDFSPGNSYILSVYDSDGDGTDYYGRRRLGVIVTAGAVTTGMDLTVGLAASVSGTVTDEAVDPIADVQIHFQVDGNDEIIGHGDVTDNNGFYEVKFLEPGHNYKVRLTPFPASSYVYKEDYVEVPDTDPPTDFVLESGAITIDGFVTEESTGDPLQNIEVIYWRDGSQTTKGDYTDVSGYYQLTNLPAGEARVQTRPASTYAHMMVRGDFTASTQIDFALVPESIISGVVTAFDTGLPFADFRVHLENRRGGWDETRTEADGSFIFTGLSEGINMLRVEPPVDSGYAQQYKYIYTAEGDAVADADFLLERGALISGRVEDPSAAGIPDMYISAKGPGRDIASGRTDSDGTFQLRLSPGEHMVSISDIDDGQHTAMPVIVDIADAGDDQAITITVFTLATGAETIEGSVNNPGGYPHVSFFGVAAFPAGYVLDQTTAERIQPLSYSEVGDAGPYTLLVPPSSVCDIYLVVGVPETEDSYAGTLTMRGKLIDVPADSPGNDLLYDEEGGQISGIITDGVGDPICMAIVCLLDISDELAGFAYTNELGEYTFYNIPTGAYVPAKMFASAGDSYPEGPYTIGAWHEDYGYSDEIVVEELVDGETTEMPPIVMERDWILNMTEMPWYENVPAYNSTGAAACQMILNYILEGARLIEGDGVELLEDQDQIYEYARGDGTELTPDDVDKILGHFDPYDTLVSNWADSYDSLPDGNPYQGYNYTVDTYDPAAEPDALTHYMRDICHWMAYTVTKENWWDDGELVARPNTPAAIPLYGRYDRWVAVQGYAASENPTPEPHTNPSNTPDFTVYGFWIKAPFESGLGETSFISAAECEDLYFKPVTGTGDSYEGLYVQVAEPPAERSMADVVISQPVKNTANVKFLGAEAAVKDDSGSALSMAMSVETGSKVSGKPVSGEKKWTDLVDKHLLSDDEAVAAFEGTRMRKPILVNGADENAGYYLVPFDKQVRGKRRLTSGVVVLDAKDGYFKQASWTNEPEKFLKVNKAKALFLIRKYILKERYIELKDLIERFKKEYRNRRRMSRRRYRDLIRNYRRERRAISRKYAKLLSYLRNTESQLIWEPNSYATSVYKPYWKVDANGYIWYVTQGGKVISEGGLPAILDEIEDNNNAVDRFFRRNRLGGE